MTTLFKHMYTLIAYQPEDGAGESSKLVVSYHPNSKTLVDRYATLLYEQTVNGNKFDMLWQVTILIDGMDRRSATMAGKDSNEFDSLQQRVDRLFRNLVENHGIDSQQKTDLD